MTRAIPLAGALVGFVVFSPVLWHGFLDWDDIRNLAHNPAYRGLGWTQLRWMFTTFLSGHYVPVTWLTFGLDYVVWGMNPVGYHLTSLLLHAANAALFYFLGLRLLGKATHLSAMALAVGAGAATLFFALHPLRVESVAWLTERRGVLSGFFVLGTVLTYLEAAEAEGGRRRRLLCASVGAYLLATASKASVMTLPLVLMLLDVYPLRRLAGGRQAALRPAARGVWLEKLPYMIIALAGAVASRVAVGASVTPLETHPWSARLSMVLYGLWFHFFKTLLPLDLSPLYQLPARVDPLEPRFLLSGVGTIAISAIAVLLRRVFPAGLAVWLYHGLTLAPVLGVLHVGPQLTADRYSYLPGLGWALLFGAGAALIVHGRDRGLVPGPLARVAAGLAVAWLLALGTLTWQQAGIWRDTERLWRHAVAVTPDCSTCHFNLGVWLAEQGTLLPALEHLLHAAALRPDRVSLQGDVGLVLERLGLFAQAAERYERVVARYPHAPAPRLNLAVALACMGRLMDAIEQLGYATRVRRAAPGPPANPDPAPDRLRDPAVAAEWFRHAIAARPDAAAPRLGLALAYLALGKLDLAREQSDALRALSPDLASRTAIAFARGR